MREGSEPVHNPIFDWCGGRKMFNGYIGWLTAIGAAYFLEATYTQVMMFSLIALGISVAGNAISDLGGK